MNLTELKKSLVLAKKERPNEIPQLLPDAQSYFEVYQQIKNVLEACGFEQMDIYLKEK